MMDKRNYLWIPAILVYLASTWLTTKLISATFQGANYSFIFLISGTLIGMFYYLPKCSYLHPPDLIYYISRVVIIVLGIISIGSSVGGINAYFMKANRTVQDDKNIQNTIDTANKVIADRDSVKKLSQNMWYQYNNQQKQEANVAGLGRLLQSDTYLTNRKDMESVGYLYSLCKVIGENTGIAYNVVQLGTTTLLAIGLDLLGITLFGMLFSKKLKKGRSIKGTLFLNRFERFKKGKSHFMSFENYAERLWKGVNPKFWYFEETTLCAMNTIPIKRKTEVSYRKIMIERKMIKKIGIGTRPLMSKEDFMKLAREIQRTHFNNRKVPFDKDKVTSNKK